MKQFENIYYFFSNTEFSPDKFLKSIFIDEADTESKNSKTPKLLVINVENTINHFTFKSKVLDYNCTYLCQKLDSEKTVFKVSIVLKYTTRKEQAANAFSELIRTIKANKKSEFNMTVIQDSLSTYYSERLYSKLAFYERSMRALITAIFIPVYKDSWAEKLKDSLGKDIKGNKKELLEGLLETLDLSDLESIFFDKKLNINVDNYDSEFDIHNIESLSKEELVKKIRHNRPVSLWEKEISKYAIIDDAQGRMKKIRGLRNKIAHNKSFTDRNFNSLKIELNFITLKLNEAEDKILSDRDTEVLNQTLKRMVEKINELDLKKLVPNFEAIEKISAAVKQLVSKEIFYITQQIPVMPLSIQNTLQNIESISRYKLDGTTEDENEDTEE